MWPMLLDMTPEECVQSLRHLELQAYSSLVSALRAQGVFSQEKQRLLKETSELLHISNDRHKAEIRRAISDERLNTVAYHMTGEISSFEEWTREGRRVVPLLPRSTPQTPYSVVADEASDFATQHNKQLPFPVNTERKRALIQTFANPTTVVETNGSFRVPEVPKDDLVKKRKYHSIGETSSLVQHLLAPKPTKIQQIYRQASMKGVNKPKAMAEVNESPDLSKSRINGNFGQNQLPNSKINILQNITIQASKSGIKEHSMEVPVSKSFISQSADQTVEPVPVKKSLNISPKKVIVVSNAQTLPTNSSILQKTLSVPMNKLTKLNLDKFKIVPNAQLPSNISNNTKPKLVTIKGTANKKVIPFSQLQMLNSKGLRVVPYSGKLNEKNFSATPLDLPAKKLAMIDKNGLTENGEQFADTKIGNNHETEVERNTDNAETYGNNSNGDLSPESECDQTKQEGEVLQELQVIQSTEKLMQ
ncbi:hypothetical protein ABEB36_008115 [Hypothenemus hampei]|uniref:ENT domain-containing protein n=1 Tax=Hypothenemus hampei TaxID=57062 RepID=A0ABD1EKW2_HYPHA